MKERKRLKINGTMLDQYQLGKHLEKVAASHTICSKSQKETYPIPDMIENFEIITEVYNTLNEDVKLGITIHPAGEWLLDNFYIIEESVKQIQKELSIKKYRNFVGIANGEYKGFARSYVLASEIVAYTDNQIERGNLEEALRSYQTKKTLSMDEIWNMGIFLQIAMVQNIAEICKNIYQAQMQKHKVESILERLVENKEKKDWKFKINNISVRNKKQIFQDTRYPFIEYMSYSLKKYGKKGYSYLQALEETIEKLGTTVAEIIKKEHFNIAVQKVLMGNAITSIKQIQRINFLEIFEKINGVEDILRQDPAEVYSKMDYKTKEYYRGMIKELSIKTKISEIYIAKKTLELSLKNKKGSKQSHIGYYLIGEGKNQLYQQLEYKTSREMTSEEKVKTYVLGIIASTLLLCFILTIWQTKKLENIWISIISFLIFLIPVSEVCIQIIHSILNKCIKPKQIPKLDFQKGIDKEHSTMVVIPTILKSKEKVAELINKLEVYYLANESPNLYFTLLGDCSESKNETEEFDQEIINQGKQEIEKLNQKYQTEGFPIFHFTYRNRIWNSKEESYLGWERKRGMLTQLNEYLQKKIKNPFATNTIEEYKKDLPKIKYVITLDADTDLILNSAFELVGAMAHILNTPVIDEERNRVIDGYGIMQPRVGINLDISYQTLFTKVFAGAGGIDSYTNAISDIYQDNFKEGIFTGKGIYDVEVFSKILNKEIPENTVLSHDLLEGCYLRSGLATDILLMDGYPTKYNSYMTRQARWIRGDWQIIRWIKSKKLNLLSKYKIVDNLRRSILEIGIITAILLAQIIAYITKTSQKEIFFVLVIIAIIPFILELLKMLIFKKEGEQKQQPFTPKISGIKGILLRAVLTLGCLPNKAYTSLKSIVQTIYRMRVSKKHLLEWTTSEEAEKQAKTDILSYVVQMASNIILGIVVLFLSIGQRSILGALVAILWIITPGIMYYMSKDRKENIPINRLDKKEQEYIKTLGKETWQYFKDFLQEENNYLITDNYQADRKEKIVPRTSSTNIGLSLLAIIASYDLGFTSLEEAIDLLSKVMSTIESLPKWNGHLYNWYNIKTKEPLIPRYISTVDSGNYVGYLYMVKTFLEEVQEKLPEEKQEEIKSYQMQIENQIKNTDFSLLYSKEHRMFSIGFNIEENKLTDSYYDLLASEARQASLVAIAKKDVPEKHWNSLSRTLTILGKRKGLISWSGTAFEYLMPNINIPKYQGSLLDESCKFLVMCQIEYAKKLGVPWGVSESAFNLKDLNGNYQYKAFGTPWLGLKRGLADEIVVAPYGSILAITDYPKEVVENLTLLEQYEMKGKYGFYEAIDFTPERLGKGKKAAPVKTYMAHHQGLILLSINNLFHNQIFQKRFMKNPELEAVSILLQETMPETSIITKENKEKIEKLKYKDYEDYSQEVYTKIDERLLRGNVIGNEEYAVAMNQKGEGVSKYKDIYINSFKNSDEGPQGIFFAIKNIRNKAMVTTRYHSEEENKYKISFMPDRMEQEIRKENIEIKTKITVAPNEPVEIRTMTLENLGQSEEILEITSYFEPVLSKKEQNYAHPAFNKLFLVFEYDEETGSILVKRKKRNHEEVEIHLAANLATQGETVGDLEYEIDAEKLIGNGNSQIPQMIENSNPLSKKIGLVTEPMVALKRTIKLKPGEKVEVHLILAVGENKHEVLEGIKKYGPEETIKKALELGKAKTEAQNRYLRIKGTEAVTYQKMLSYLIFDNPFKKRNKAQLPKKLYKQKELWKYGISGDIPVVLVKIKDLNDIHVVREMLKAYEFFRLKKTEVELVFLDEEKHSYENYVREEIESVIQNHHMAYLKNARGGIFSLTKNEMDNEDKEILEFVASIIIDGKKGGVKNALHELEEEYLEKTRTITNEPETNYFEEDNTANWDILEHPETLKYYNEYGAFSEDGKEYFIRTTKDNRLPTVWSHILANEKFGTLVTQNMGGYTWYKNCRLNRMTSWENKPNYDHPSEIIYLKDQENKKSWSLGLNPKPDDKNYNIIYGFGYATYIHQSNGLEQTMQVFVPEEDSAKIQILKLKNKTPNKKKLKLYYYLKLVLGEDETKSNGNIHLKWDETANILYGKNLYNSEFPNQIMYMASSEKIKSFTGEKDFFLGKGSIRNPDALKKPSLNNEDSLGKESCMVCEIEIEIESFGEKEITLVMGAEENLMDSKNTAYKYSKVQNGKQELERIKNYWKEQIGKLQVETPLESTNILLNGWLIYQTIVSRLLAKTGYYQSGGAYGFRDQLQDTLGLKFMNPEILKNQIIKHSKRQFLEGDVQHWWNEETNKGIRTRFSDDLLWMIYLTLEYIDFTGDNSILEEETPYLEGKILEENEDEKYDLYPESKETGDIFDHCIRAIEKSLNFGENGLPKIGSGDWNDGLSTVGNKGKGESVWLGFFLYDILDRWIPICQQRYKEELAQKYEEIKSNLKRALNTKGWDGRWYKRAFTDDGDVLGSMENEECRIDSIAQSWSIISGAGENDKKYISMESLENHLVDRENGIIKLLDPPFEKGKLEPGYIKSYLPGVRENGGQYTHAAIWVILAQTMLGFGDKALELYRMINPIEHSRTKESSKKYKVEPYVIPADIYGASNLAGRGGWTWYTGSSSWYYKAGIEYLLGLQIEKGFLKVNPCIPKEWKEYKIHYKWRNSIYHITVYNPNGKNTGIEKITINGEKTENNIRLEEKGVYSIEVIL